MIAKNHIHPSVSVVIVNYNVKDFLFQCLQSLRKAAESLSVEVIVVDNHSLDGSIDFLEPLFPDVEFIRLTENIGFGKANNVGFERANGEFVLCLNPDCIVSEQTLSVMLGYMNAHPEVGLSGCKLLNGDGTFQLPCRRAIPTPWVSFTKMFGLQKIFPKSRLFGRYNLTFLDENETYYVEAVSGAFMFIRRTALEPTKGFDPDFFMYGEDLDLCYRISKAGWKISYVHSTSAVHFKGESTRRSSINEVKIFYSAMEIFVDKHFSSSRTFRLLLRFAISVRASLAYISRHTRPIVIGTLDLLLINLALIVSTRLRMGTFFGFPDYAYPTVFIVLSLVFLLSMIFAGEYGAREAPSPRKALTGLMMSFFALSALTYFTKDYAFSRTVLLLTIIFGVFLTTLVRVAAMAFEKIAGKEADRRIAIIGINDVSERLIADLQRAETRNATIVGVIAEAATSLREFAGKPILANIEYLQKTIERNSIDEVIITDQTVPRFAYLKMMNEAAQSRARFRFADGYDEVVSARIIENFTGKATPLQQYNITLLKYRFLKRLTDILGSVFLLSIGLPFVYLISQDARQALKTIIRVFRGSQSIFGLYPVESRESPPGKQGLIGLAHINQPQKLSNQALQNLNDYYARHYSLSLDFEILIKFFFRRNSGIEQNNSKNSL